MSNPREDIRIKSTIFKWSRIKLQYNKDVVNILKGDNERHYIPKKQYNFPIFLGHKMIGRKNGIKYSNTRIALKYEIYSEK